DCLNGICRANAMSPTGSTCYPLSCNDGTKNGSETAVDCGGSCAPCADGSTCMTNADCLHALCSAGVCFGSRCSGMMKDGNETDVDCGGSSCPKCGLGRVCMIDTDCATVNCNTAHICTQSSCGDMKTDGAETDTDCGGGTCPTCAVNKKCITGT